MRALWSKIQNVHHQGRLRALVRSKTRLLGYALRSLQHDAASHHIQVHCPEYVDPPNDTRELEIVERIFRAFKRMKADQRWAPRCYLPSALWQAQLDEGYASLAAGLAADDLRPFHVFLANFGTWKTYLGVEASTLIREHMRSSLGKRYLTRVLFGRQLKIWQWFYNHRKPLTCLTYPQHGNQAGAYIDGIFVGPGSFFNEIYGALLRPLISDLERPVVADLGGGYGKLAYFTLRDLPRFTFIDFDLPETLCLAAYYLMHVWPDKRVLLYGEEAYSPATHGRYDVILMPSYEIEKVGKESVDLFLNKNSLGEMTKESVTAYIGHIAQATRYFFHMNHDVTPATYATGDRGLLGYEYPVPMDTFTLRFRYPDISHLLYEGGLDFDQDIFWYLYERKTRQRVSRDELVPISAGAEA